MTLSDARKRNEDGSKTAGQLFAEALMAGLSLDSADAKLDRMIARFVLGFVAVASGALLSVFVILLVFQPLVTLLVLGAIGSGTLIVFGLGTLLFRILSRMAGVK